MYSSRKSFLNTPELVFYFTDYDCINGFFLYPKKHLRQGNVFWWPTSAFRFRSIWGRGLSGLITVLEDKQYMIMVREKMNNIKKVAKFHNYDLLLAKK